MCKCIVRISGKGCFEHVLRPAGLVLPRENHRMQAERSGVRWIQRKRPLEASLRLRPSALTHENSGDRCEGAEVVRVQRVRLLQGHKRSRIIRFRMRQNTPERKVRDCEFRSGGHRIAR